MVWLVKCLHWKHPPEPQTTEEVGTGRSLRSAGQLAYTTRQVPGQWKPCLKKKRVVDSADLFPDPHTRVPICMCEHIHKKRTWCLHDSNKKNDKAVRNMTDLEKETVWKEARWEARSLCINVGLHIHRAITGCYSFGNIIQCMGSTGGRGRTE